MNFKNGMLLIIPLLLALVLATPPSVSAQNALVSIDFASRSTAGPAISPGMFGINLSQLQDSGAINVVTQAGFTQVRRMSHVPTVYSTTTPNWGDFDWAMKQAQTAGLHPIIVMANTPAWLQPSPNACSGLTSLSHSPPSNLLTWAQIAASYVAHLDGTFPGLVQDFEIWNEPDSQNTFCVADNTDATRLKTYVALYAAAAAAMRAQATRDGVRIRIGGPAITRLRLATEWITALLSNPQAAPNVDFVSYHFYPTGTQEVSSGMTWSTLYGITQSSTRGVAARYALIADAVRKTSQPNASTTPIYITEYNDGWAFIQDCCRNDPTYGPLWNSVTLVDLLNAGYNGWNVPGRMYYYAGSAPPYFCILGAWNTAMDCNASVYDPYPQYYTYELFASSNYLGLTNGGNLAQTVSLSTSALLATAFYTLDKDAIVIVNPTSTTYSQVSVEVQNPGFTAIDGTLYLLDSLHGHINTQSLSLTAFDGGYRATIGVPGYSTVAITLKAGSSSLLSPVAKLSLSGKSGTAPLTVTADSSGSYDPDGTVVSRSFDFGDGSPRLSSIIATHTYTVAGTFNATLDITDSSGLHSKVLDTITVLPGTRQIVPVLNVTPQFAIMRENVIADSSGTAADPGAIMSRVIDWGDGSPLTSAITATHRFLTPGKFLVRLTIRDRNGRSWEITKAVVILRPVPDGRELECGTARNRRLGC